MEYILITDKDIDKIIQTEKYKEKGYVLLKTQETENKNAKIIMW